MRGLEANLDNNELLSAFFMMPPRNNNALADPVEAAAGLFLPPPPLPAFDQEVFGRIDSPRLVPQAELQAPIVAGNSEIDQIRQHIEE